MFYIFQYIVNFFPNLLYENGKMQIYDADKTETKEKVA